MISYRYKALSNDGAKVNGVVEAIDEMHAVEKIREKCPIVIDISEVKTGGIYDILNIEIGKKVDVKALSVMCSQFAIILSAGTPINQALHMIASQTQDSFWTIHLYRNIYILVVWEWIYQLVYAFNWNVRNKI